MPEAYKILGQSFPGAATLTDIYTVPAIVGTVNSSITICNQSSTQTALIRVSQAIGGAVDTPEQYIYYDLDIPPNDTFIATIGVTLAPGDVIRVYSDLSIISFNMSGTEIS